MNAALNQAVTWRTVREWSGVLAVILVVTWALTWALSMWLLP